MRKNEWRIEEESKEEMKEGERVQGGRETRHEVKTPHDTKNVMKMS